MLRRLMILPLFLVLTACQSPPLHRDYDPQRDYSTYHRWSWKEPAVQYRPDDPRIRSDLTERRIREAVAEQLDQRGLRPVETGEADLLVQTWFIVDERTQQYSSTAMGGWGSPWHGYYWGAPVYTDTRTLHYQVATMQLDLYDARDGKLVWRGSTERTLRQQGSPAERAGFIREIIAQVLSQYPPR